MLLPADDEPSIERVAALTVNELLVPVWPLPSFAVMVTPEPAVVRVTDPVHTPLDHPLVLVLVGLIVPDEAESGTEREYVVTVLP